jgi:hypothetical protein
MFHGGDFKGLTSSLDRIKSLGFTSIWVTPPVKQQTMQGNSSAYHGYWGLDFTTIDPHLGTEYDFKEFVDKLNSKEKKKVTKIINKSILEESDYEEIVKILDKEDLINTFGEGSFEEEIEDDVNEECQSGLHGARNGFNLGDVRWTRLCLPLQFYF